MDSGRYETMRLSPRWVKNLAWASASICLMCLPLNQWSKSTATGNRDPAQALTLADVDVQFHDLDSLIQKRWNGSIPFPPEKIVEDLLESDPRTIVTAAIFPHGRSLERAFTDGVNPRTIFSWRYNRDPRGPDVSRPPVSGTFFAYTPKNGAT
jgi:hypothetical protein